MPLRPAKINRGNDGLAPVLRIHGVDRSMESFLALSPRECKLELFERFTRCCFFGEERKEGRKVKAKS